MTIILVTRAVAQPIKTENQSTIPSALSSSNNFLLPTPNVTGIANKKENLVASSLDIPASIPPGSIAPHISVTKAGKWAVIKAN